MAIRTWNRPPRHTSVASEQPPPHGPVFGPTSPIGRLEELDVPLGSLRMSAGSFTSEAMTFPRWASEAVRLATWNVNSVRARLDRVVDWLDLAAVDVLCLQELKGSDEVFPRAAIESLGYHASVYGQKGRNGVAILSRRVPDEVICGFGDGRPEDAQARIVRARFRDLWIVNLYAPSGGSHCRSPSYAYKLGWYERLLRAARGWLQGEERWLICGDFNIVPQDRDAARPDRWRDTPVAHEEIRAYHWALLGLGLEDVLRMHHEGCDRLFTWWAYGQRCFERDEGLRLDHVLAPLDLALRSGYAFVDREERAGHKPSDHAPVVCAFEGL